MSELQPCYMELVTLCTMGFRPQRSLAVLRMSHFLDNMLCGSANNFPKVAMEAVVFQVTSLR
jgi:hypothetical protein